MFQISKCPRVTVVLSYFEASGEVSKLSYKSLLFDSSRRSYCSSDWAATDGLLQFCIYWVTTVCPTASFRLQCTVKKNCQTFVNMVWCVVMFTRHVMQAIMGRAMRAVLREIKWALNLQPWTAPVVHQQCVRRCIFVDHH